MRRTNSRNALGNYIYYIDFEVIGYTDSLVDGQRTDSREARVFNVWCWDGFDKLLGPIRCLEVGMLKAR